MKINIRNSNRKFCNRCKQVGNHTELLCNEPVEQYCCFCGQVHKLASQECGWKICKKCFKSHASNASCQVSVAHSLCSICNIRGHSDELCTNNWRLFLNWTDPNDLNNLKTPVLRYFKSCLTCGSTNHSSFQCPKLRNTLHFCNPSPSPKIVNKLKQQIITEFNELMTDKQVTILIDDGSPLQIDEMNDVSKIECDLKAQASINENVNNDQTDHQNKNEDFETNTYQLTETIRNQTKNRKKMKKKKTPRKYENASSIDKKIKSQAIRFNQITMKNVSNFVIKNAQSPNSKKLTKNGKKSNKHFQRIRKFRQKKKKSQIVNS